VSEGLIEFKASFFAQFQGLQGESEGLIQVPLSQSMKNESDTRQMKKDLHKGGSLHRATGM
jgi:hypothetical protein